MDHVSFSLGLVLFLGVFGQVLFWKMRIPTVLGLAVVGILLGPTFQIVRPSQDFGILFIPIIKLALAIILFEGGLSLKLHELKEAGRGVKRLITLNTFFGFGLTYLLSLYLLGFSWVISLILASILIVTGPTVIIPMLRHAKLNRKVNAYLKWEGIINDPIGVMLAIFFMEYTINVVVKSSGIHFLQDLGISLVVVFTLVYLANKTINYLFENNQIPHYLKLPVILGSVIFVYTIPNLFFEEAGLLATTLFGIVLGNSKTPYIDQIRRFKEDLTTLMISVVFILLAANVEFSTLAHINFRMILFFFLIMFVVRPISVFLSMIKTDLNFKEKLFVGLIAPRGIVSAALTDFVAIRLVSYGFPEAEKLIPLIFLVIFGSVLLNSLFINPLARSFKLSYKGEKTLIIGANPWTLDLALKMQELKIPTIISDSNSFNLNLARCYGIPVHYGEVLSEFMEEDMDLNNIGHVLAATDNDAYNSLVCTRYQHDLGKEKVHQLAFKGLGKIKGGFIGNIIGDEKFTYGNLLKLHGKDASFKVIDIQEDNLKLCKEQVEQENIFPVVIKRTNGNVQIYNANQPLVFNPSDSVIFYGSHT